MDVTAFRSGPAGRLIKTPHGYWAWVPNPLPPKLSFDLNTMQVLSEADRTLGNLAGVGETLPNPYLLIAPFSRREAVLSSRIEGTQASLSDLLYFEAASVVRRSDVREVRNYILALEYGLKRLQTLPVCLRLIREVHEHLTEGVRGEQVTPGEFRSSQNWIGPAGCSLNDATYVPPPVPEMHEALDEFERYLHKPSNLPPLIQLALIHYQFEAIHPFLDGNGRIGRLLIPLFLCASGDLPKALLYLSAYFERYRQRYYDLLLAVSQAGAWNDWITFFLKGIAAMAKDAVARSRKIITLQQDYRQRFTKARTSVIPLRLIDHLFLQPMITVPNAAQVLGITYIPAAKAIKTLEELGIVREVTGQKRNRIYLAEELFATIDEELPELQDTSRIDEGAEKEKTATLHDST